MYFKRNIDKELLEWAGSKAHKPLLLRGARQVGKSTAVRELGKGFQNFVEINFEKEPVYKSVFKQDLDAHRIVSEISAMCGSQITDGETLLFMDEIQECPEAIMSLRFFKEDKPDLHVVAAGSLLEFAIEQLPTYGVGRIHSMFIYPMTFDEFLMATGNTKLLEFRNKANAQTPLSEATYNKLIELFRTFILVGGMPEVVAKWVSEKNYLNCQEIQDDIVSGYLNDFPKYSKRADVTLLTNTFKSVVSQVTQKFMFSKVEGGYKAGEVKKALDLLTKAGLVIPVTHSDANGLPLGEKADESVRKYLFLDNGLMLRVQNLTLKNASEITQAVLSSSANELVNKGPMAEMIAGLELLHNMPSTLKTDLYYWNCQKKNSMAEIDYILPDNMKVLPFEVKAGVQGGMKSLWRFMKEKSLSNAIRCSLENFGEFSVPDPDDANASRHVRILPLFAISQL